MITQYNVRVKRSWYGVVNGQVVSVPEQRARYLVSNGFAEFAEDARDRQITREIKIPVVETTQTVTRKRGRPRKDSK
jgi:hypothetical protein